MPKIGLILGSTRLESNTSGIHHHLLSLLTTNSPNWSIETINLRTSPNHPLPLLLDPLPPAGHPLTTLPSAYTDESVQEWSKTVMSWDGMIILTPQYNWGIPAPLKNALDHLFNEFHDMPVGILTCGGRGGGKCADALRIVLGGGMDMRVCERSVGFKLPGEVIRGSERVKGDEEWLKEYDGEVLELVKELEGMLRPRFGEGAKEIRQR